MSELEWMTCERCHDLVPHTSIYQVRQTTWMVVQPAVQWCADCLIGGGTKTTLFRVGMPAVPSDNDKWHRYIRDE